MSKITLIIENDKTKNVQIDSSHTALDFINLKKSLKNI